LSIYAIGLNTSFTTYIKFSPIPYIMFSLFLFRPFGFTVFLLPKTLKLLGVPICWTLRVIQKRAVRTKLDVYVIIVNKRNELLL